MDMMSQRLAVIPKHFVCESRRLALADHAEFSEIISNFVIELLSSVFRFLPGNLTVTAIQHDRISRQDRRKKSSHKQDSAHGPYHFANNARRHKSRGDFVVTCDFITSA